jgi:ABC-type transporter Mla MlaB component
MLMITLETDAPIPTVRLDGQLSGPEVRELARHWRTAFFTGSQQRVLFDLAGVTSVDASGREFLAKVHRHGDTLVGGAATGPLVEEIRRHAVTDDWPSDEPRAVYEPDSPTVHAFFDRST